MKNLLRFPSSRRSFASSNLFMFWQEQLENLWTDAPIEICKRKSSCQKQACPVWQMVPSFPAQQQPRQAPIPSSKSSRPKKRLKRWEKQFQKNASLKPRIHQATKQTTSAWHSLHKFNFIALRITFQFSQLYKAKRLSRHLKTNQRILRCENKENQTQFLSFDYWFVLSGQ